LYDWRADDYNARMRASPPPSARHLLEARGVAATAARVQVLDMLLAAPTALTHAALMRAAADAGQPLDKVTLYRVLDWLVAQDLAHDVTGSDRARRFRALRMQEGHAHGEHAHFECDACGRLFCLPDPAASPRTPPGFESRRIDVTVHGRCADCARHPA
jgi:Fur family ferric uptake transcriptional regulator